MAFWAWADHAGLTVGIAANFVWLWRIHRKVNGNGH